MKLAALAGPLVLLGIVLGACNGELRFEDTPDAASSSSGIRCAVDADCRLASLHCDTVSAQCVACIVDAHCTRGDENRCDPDTHRCVACNVDTDCFGGRACETTTKRCVLRCSAQVPCPPGAPWCSADRGVCLRCRTDGDCVGSDDGPTCDTEAGHCVTCTSDAQCSAGLPRCERTHGHCVRCTSSADCPSGQVCDPDVLTCL